LDILRFFFMRLMKYSQPFMSKMAIYVCDSRQTGFLVFSIGLLISISTSYCLN
jgi:hypothetical protein